MASKEDMQKLDQCLDILDSTDLGLSMVWLWTWSTIDTLLQDEDFISLKTKDEIWDLLVTAVDSGIGFSLEYGAEDHYEAVREWMFDQGIMVDPDDVEEVLEDMENEDGDN